MEALRFEGYLPKFPRNPFMKRNLNKFTEEMSDEEWDIVSRMQEIQYAQFIPGNFAYLPVLTSNADGEIHATGYDLLVFGEKPEPRLTDYFESENGFPVLLMLSNRADMTRYKSPETETAQPE